MTDLSDNVKERNAAKFAVAAFLASVFFLLILVLGAPGRTLDEPWIALIALTAVNSVPGFAFLLKLLRGHASIAKPLAFATGIFLLGAAMSSYAALHLVNRVFDGSEAQASTGIVLESRSGSRGGPGSSTVRLEGADGESVTISGQHQNGFHAVVWIRSGLLGWRWIERAEVQPSRR